MKNMISLDEAVKARYDSKGKHFEILVDPESSLSVKKEKKVDLENLIASREVFVDADKGKKASEKDLNQIFGTNDLKKIVYSIIKNGEIQLTTEQKRKMRERKKKRIVEIISKRGINPQTNTPHPPKRILNALEETGVNIDPRERVESQIERVVEAIRPIIPISFEEIKIAVKIPSEYAGKTSSQLRKIGKLEKEEWTNKGEWIAVIKLRGGETSEFYDTVNKLTKGEAEVKELD